MKHLLSFFLLLLCLAIPAAQGQRYSISGTVGNKITGEPRIFVELVDTSQTRQANRTTDREGRFVFEDVAEGDYFLRIRSYFQDTIMKVSLHSNLVLDTLYFEAQMKTYLLWYLQRTDPQPTADPYFRQYLAFRRAIDSLPLVFNNSNYTYNVDSIPDANSVLATLHGVTIEKDWLLDVHYEGNSAWGRVKFYTRHKDEFKMLRGVMLPRADLPDHITVDFTPEGIWSAYQLANSICYLPKFWHGYYGDCCGIFSLDEVRRRSPELRDSLAATPEIRNRVEIIDDGHARVIAYWWNDWEGLFEETVFVERKGHTVQFFFPDSKNPDPRTSTRTLVRYDCGIMY